MLIDKEQNHNRYIVGVDIGGTFTDAAAFDLQEEALLLCKDSNVR